jgi:hypothetical protein
MFRHLLLILMLLFGSLVAQAQEITLVPGQPTAVTIDADSPAPSLIFVAEAGQRLSLQLVSITDTLFPILTIYTADEEILQYVGNPARSTTLEAVAVIPLTGSYRLEIWNTDGVPGQIILLMEDLTSEVTAPADTGPTPPAFTPEVDITAPPPDTGCVVMSDTTLPVNVREGPSTVFHAFAALSPGESFAVTGRDNPGDWYRIEVNGVEGWVAASVTRLAGDCANLEVIAVRVPTRTPTPTPTPTPTSTPTSTPTLTATPTPPVGGPTQISS